MARACDKLRSAERILLTSHRRPDGDGTGSMAGLASLLRARGKIAVIYSMDPIARRYRWLPLANTTVHTIPFDERFDCTVVVDCADIALLGDALPPPEVCGTLITLDHHASGRPFGDIAVWDPSAAAVGVLVHRIAVREGWPVTPEAAVPLYVSLISDTGGYRHANTNAEALHVGSELIKAGVVPSTIAASLEERPSPGKLRLLGSVLSTLELHCAGRAGVLSVTTEMSRCARVGEDIEGMVNWGPTSTAAVGCCSPRQGGGVRVSSARGAQDRRRQGLHDARRRRSPRCRRLPPERRSGDDKGQGRPRARCRVQSQPTCDGAPSGIDHRAGMLRAMIARVFAFAGVTALAVACGGGGSSGPDAADAPIDADPLGTIEGTGLCLDAACTQISADVRTYRPQYELWHDGATKRRWMQLPAGQKIDTTDPDHWVFPVGTKFWKEFTRHGIRVETRLIEKLLADEEDPGAWLYVTYAWNVEQTVATRAPAGVIDANGTGHDIPAPFACRTCHEGVRPGRILGFQALSLDFDAPVDSLDLDELIAMQALTVDPPGAASPHYPFPTEASAVEQAAFGYVHANCGHCHNPTSPVVGNTPLDLRLVTTRLTSVANVPAYATTVDVDAAVPFSENGTTYTKVIISGSPDTSGLIVRMNSTSLGRRMPSTASEITDPAGQAALRAWIEAL